MKIIEKNFTGVITPKQCNRNHVLNERKMGQEVVDMIETYLGMLEGRKTAAVCQSVLDVISDLIHLKLTFKAGESHHIVGVSPRGKEYIIVGQWNDNGSYSVQSCLRRRDNRKKAIWLLNGQPDTGTELIAFYGGEVLISFPEFKVIIDNYMKKCI